MTGNTHSKIVIVTHEFAPFRGGAGVYCEELAAALRRAGREVEVWKPRRPGSLHVRHLAPLAWRVWRQRHELRASTAVAGSRGAHWIFMLLRPQCARLVILVHGSELLKRSRRFEDLLRQADVVIAPSEFTKSIVPAGIKVVVAPPAPSSAAAMPVAEPATRDSRVRVLTVARIHPRKGQLDVARALASLRTDSVYQCAGAGDTSYLQEIERACRSGGVAFEYLGEIPSDRLAATYAQCDIFAMTSRTLPGSIEGFGIAFLEAAFHGKPVVAYRSGGVPEAVEDGRTGLLVPEGDAPALAGALNQLIADRQLRRQLGEAGRERARRFTWDRTAEVLLR